LRGRDFERERRGEGEMRRGRDEEKREKGRRGDRAIAEIP